MSYYTAYICKNGHVDSADRRPSHKLCRLCGEEIIYRCAKCGAVIEGKEFDEEPGTIAHIGRYELPYHCPWCGEPYPWKTALLNRIFYALSLDADISDETKNAVMKAMPDLIAEGILTPIAIAEYRIVSKKLPDVIRETLRDILINVVSDTVAQKLFS